MISHLHQSFNQIPTSSENYWLNMVQVFIEILFIQSAIDSNLTDSATGNTGLHLLLSIHFVMAFNTNNSSIIRNCLWRNQTLFSLNSITRPSLSWVKTCKPVYKMAKSVPFFDFPLQELIVLKILAKWFLVCCVILTRLSARKVLILFQDLQAVSTVSPSVQTIIESSVVVTPS